MQEGSVFCLFTPSTKGRGGPLGISGGRPLTKRVSCKRTLNNIFMSLIKYLSKVKQEPYASSSPAVHSTYSFCCYSCTKIKPKMNAGIKGRQIRTNRLSYLGSPSKGPAKKQLRDLTSVVDVGGREEKERCPKVLARKNFFAPGGCRKGWAGMSLYTDEVDENFGNGPMGGTGQEESSECLKNVFQDISVFAFNTFFWSSSSSKRSNLLRMKGGCLTSSSPSTHNVCSYGLSAYSQKEDYSNLRAMKVYKKKSILSICLSKFLPHVFGWW